MPFGVEVAKEAPMTYFGKSVECREDIEDKEPVSSNCEIRDPVGDT